MLCFPAALHNSKRKMHIPVFCKLQFSALSPCGAAAPDRIKPGLQCLLSLQDPRQEKTILALQELYDQLSSGIRPKRPSGLTITDHVGPTKKRAHWQVVSL